MNELIRIETRSVGEAEAPTVNARDLHAFLEVGRDFSNWIKARIEQYGFEQGIDFVFASSGEKSAASGRPRVDYFLSLDMAKELAMVERNEKGKRARQYFIECERRAKGDITLALSDPARLRQALLGYSERVIALEGQLAEAEPKVEFHDAVAADRGLYSMQDAAKALGTGGNRLYAFLRNKGVLRKNNLPYQKWVNAGHFEVRITYYEQSGGGLVPRPRTFVTGGGLVFVFRLLRSCAGGSATSSDLERSRRR